MYNIVRHTQRHCRLYKHICQLSRNHRYSVLNWSNLNKASDLTSQVSLRRKDDWERIPHSFFTLTEVVSR